MGCASVAEEWPVERGGVMEDCSSRRSWILGLGGMAAAGPPALSEGEVRKLLQTVGEFYAQGSTHASVRVRVTHELRGEQSHVELDHTLHRSGNRFHLKSERWISILGADRAWLYHIHAREYLEEGLASDTADQIRRRGQSQATRFVDRFALLPKIDSKVQFQKWEQHRNRSGKHLCAVIRLNVPDSTEQHWTERLWIEPGTGIVWKLTADLKGRAEADRVYMPTTGMTVWESIVLGEPPNPDLFVLHPPAGASRVKRFSLYRGR